MSEDNPLGLDLDAALKRVLNEAFEDEVPDIIRHADFPASWADRRKQLCEELTSGTYSPRHARVRRSAEESARGLHPSPCSASRIEWCSRP